jgi:dienelactone hydrolase
MKKFISLILVIAMFGLVAMKAEAKTYIDDPEKQIFFNSFAGRDLWGTEGEKIKAHGYLYLPDQKNNEAKSPLVILISGLGGQRGRDNRMCEALSDAGIACFGVRTYASRDIPHKSKWSKKFAIAGAGSRMHDAYSALAALSNHPSIDSKNVWFVGFSLGGFLAALSLDAKFTERFSGTDNDFKGYINLYGGCPKSANPELKNAIYHHFIGVADGNYDADECSDITASLKRRGVDASMTVFEGSQWKKVGHMWDSMDAASGDWYGYPEGPWKRRRDGNRYPSGGRGYYGCNLLFDFQNQSIKVKNQILTTPSDNEAMKFLNDQCPPKKGVSSSNHKITDQVDRAIIQLVKG